MLRVDIEYKNIANEQELIERINELEKLARAELMRMESLYVEDFFLISAVDKSMKLINSFLFALSERNLTVLAILTRVQMDCVLRSYASTLVSNSGDFCDKVLCENVQINTLCDSNGKKMTDKFLCKSLGNVLQLNVYELYKAVSGFVHFSSNSFKNISNIKDGKYLDMLIGKENNPQIKASYEKHSLSLANNFYYFGRILIEGILRSWFNQKERDGIQ